MRFLIGFVFLITPAAPCGRLHGEEPVVRVLAPGFTVRPLPVRLTNVNNLAFAPDGRLYALGYDGRVNRLVDTDGDGLEDKAEPYWDRPTIQVPVGMAWSPEGLYVSSHGKVSLLKDEDGDGKADREEIVASGWPPTDVPSGGVDAMGVVRNRDGNLYFGLGTPDFSNAYRVKDGKPRYDVKGERGAILKLSADHKRREVVATGIRFPYALRFNRRGDLFATDQEGETWLPGGNPLDELNHIVQGGHYGFPPRHDAYLPGVVDEPPVVGFGPQHQSTCGMVFNEAKKGGGCFGPASWDGDAFVAGFSRGKVWRVRLVKTPHGYVGKATLFARSRMLAADVAISPSNALYLTCHGGPPDWGTGPRGAGVIFRVDYADPDAPQPVAAWAAGPLDVRTAFDRPLDPAVVEGLTGRTIAVGDHVRAADRFEVLKPPYKAVELQQATPRGALKITSAKLIDDRRTLAFAADPHPWDASYAFTIPGVRAAGRAGAGSTVDLDYDLAGVEAIWRGVSGGSTWTGWWPHLDTAVVRALTAGSSEHERCFSLLRRPGRLTLRGQIKLPKGRAALRVEADVPFEAQFGTKTIASAPSLDGGRLVQTTLDSTGAAVEFTISVETGVGGRPPELHTSYSTESDPASRPLPLDRLRPSWTPVRPPTPVMLAGARPELSGGDRRKGEVVFYSEQSRCSVCHKVRGKGGDVGPDLSNLVHRDAASVYRDVAEPSAAVHPDYAPFTVALTDGRVLSGLVRSEGAGAIRVTGADAKAVVVARADVDELRPAADSIMPTGLAQALGEAKLRDLLAFLLTPPREADPKTPPRAGAPSRTRAEVEAVLGKPADGSRSSRPLKVVLAAGAQDHGPGEHDYPAWRESWKRLLERAPGIEVSTADRWPSQGQWRGADLMMLCFWNHDWSAERYRDLDAFLARGGGLVALHAALIADTEPEALARRFGLAAQPVRTKYRHGPLDLAITVPPDHPITRGLTLVHFIDETYWPMIGDPAKVEVLATAVEEAKPRPMMWTYQNGQGRVFGSVPGHYTATLDDPLFRVLILRGTAWAAHEPPGRFERLAVEAVEPARK